MRGDADAYLESLVAKTSASSTGDEPTAMPRTAGCLTASGPSSSPHKNTAIRIEKAVWGVAFYQPAVYA